MEERILELEKRAAHQENLIDELNQVIIELRGQVDILTAELAGLRDQLEQGDWPVMDAQDEPPPPHY